MFRYLNARLIQCLKDAYGQSIACNTKRCRNRLLGQKLFAQTIAFLYRKFVGYQNIIFIQAIIIADALPEGPFADIHRRQPSIDVSVGAANEAYCAVSLLHKVVYDLSYKRIHIGSYRIKQLLVRRSSYKHASLAYSVQPVDFLPVQPTHRNKCVQILWYGVHPILFTIYHKVDIHFPGLLQELILNILVEYILQLIFRFCEVQKRDIFYFGKNDSLFISHFFSRGKNCRPRFRTDRNPFVIVQHSGYSSTGYTDNFRDFLYSSHKYLHFC